MFKVSKSNGFSVKAYQGDAKTLLAFDLPESGAKNLAGFSIFVKPPKLKGYYLLNSLKFADPSVHAQVKNEFPNSSVNAPFQKFRWLHVPGTSHQLKGPVFGTYTYTVTPRYFKDGKLTPLDTKLSVDVSIDVSPFTKANTSVAFTRGFVQSQAFGNHFGIKTSFTPKGKTLLFDTSQNAGTDKNGKKFTYADVYDWAGFTAREAIFNFVNEVKKDKSLSIDVFAYDFNEPDLLSIFIQLAKEARIRIILDNATLHHNKGETKPEDQFEKLFNQNKKGNASIQRGKFSRFAHDKIFIATKNGKAQKVLTGSTNFSVTGMYVNSNHVIVFDDATVAQQYSDVFNQAWNDKVSGAAFIKSTFSNRVFPFTKKGIPPMDITFSPHTQTFADKNLGTITARLKKEKNSVLFAVMDVKSGGGDLLKELREIHSSQDVFSFGISDKPDGIALYKPGTKRGIMVTGKPVAEQLPPPFNKEKGVGLGHQIHHKFIVCDFNGKDAAVWCGSSNLASGGEHQNGDNLLKISDGDIATVFALEALALVDHFHFRNTFSGKKKAQQQPMTLSLSDWSGSYYQTDDDHCRDRLLFG